MLPVPLKISRFNCHGSKQQEAQHIPVEAPTSQAPNPACTRHELSFQDIYHPFILAVVNEANSIKLHTVYI